MGQLAYVKASLLDSRNDHLLPNEVLKVAHEGVLLDSGYFFYEFSSVMSANFETRKFRDIEVVVNTADEKRPINLTRLTASLTGSRYSFKKVAKSKGFWRIVGSYIASKTTKDSMGPKGPIENNDLQELFDKGVLVLVRGGSNHAAEGAYGPTWLADWIVVNFKPEFFKQIHELFEVVEHIAELRNESFGEGIESIIESKEREIKRLTKENGEKDDKIDKLSNELKKTNKLNKRLLKELHKANENINDLNGQLVGARADVNRLNRNLASFTPLSASTHSISFVLKLYISDLHPRRHAVRARAVDGKIWVGVYCGEEANFTRTVRDANARIVATFPVNSRDTLAYISTQLIGETVEEAHYKHWLVQGRDLPNLLDFITETLLNNDIIVGNVEVNHELLANLIEADEPEEVVEEVVPDPIEPHHPEYNFAELAQFEYYYKNRYRELREDVDAHRLYFHVGNAAARVREYVNPEAVLRLRRRRV